MTSRSIVATEDQPVTFVELFFDLVFVFSVTQIVGYFHDGFTGIAVLQAILVFWLVWWAWQQYAWSLNAADTTHALIQLAVLTATGLAFFMAVAVPSAFGGRAVWFATAYVLVRGIGLGLYSIVSVDPAQRAGVRRFNLVSIGGLIAVLIGAFLGGTPQLMFWGLAILLDLLAGQAAGQTEGWNLHPHHFAERHGLFVIIALGETLIVAAGGVSAATGTRLLLAIGLLAVATTCGLWWTYFPRAKPALDEAFVAKTGVDQAMTARDIFSQVHFLMLCGVIAFAVTVEAAVAHPDEPLALAGRVALALGVTLFVGGMAAALWRATRQVLRTRLILTGLTALAVVAAAGVPVLISFAIALVGILAIAVYEQRLKTLIAAPEAEIAGVE